MASLDGARFDVAVDIDSNIRRGFDACVILVPLIEAVACLWLAMEGEFMSKQPLEI